MKTLQFAFLLCAGLCVGLVSSEPAPPESQRPLVFKSWPPKSASQQYSHHAPQKSLYQRSIAQNPKIMVLQIRSENPVPLVFKGRQTHGNLQHQHQHQIQHPYAAASHAHVHHHAHHHAPQQLYHHYQRDRRPIKLTGPVYFNQATALGRKPLKIKLNNVKAQVSSKPSTLYEKPFKYESTLPYTSVEQKLPTTTHANFMSNHFAPIYTIPAPNLALLSDNHLHHTDTHITTTKSSPSSASVTSTTKTTSTAKTTTRKPQTYTHYKSNHYQVIEKETNDQTILDPLSGSQKLFAPDPDPSLPTSKIRPAKEPFNQPSIGKPLPADVEGNQQPAEPLVQIVGAPEIYPVQFAQSLIAAQPVASIPIYDPTYLVTQSNQLYSAHRQQLFKPNVVETVVANAIEPSYPDADLTQIVASDGQILQAAKDPHNNIHPVLDASPQFAALIAAPSLGAHGDIETTPFHLPNVAHHQAHVDAQPSGFVASNYYGPIQDSSQLLQAYAEEEAQREHLEAAASLDLQKQQHLLSQEQQFLEQQQQHHLAQQQQLHQLAQQQQLAHQQHQLAQQQQHQLAHQQHQLAHQEALALQQPSDDALHHYQQLQQQQQTQLQAHPQQALDPAGAAFEEHQRLVKQQLGADTPLRIFVPDEDLGDSRLKRSEEEEQTEGAKQKSKEPSKAETKPETKGPTKVTAKQLNKEALKGTN